MMKSLIVAAAGAATIFAVSVTAAPSAPTRPLAASTRANLEDAMKGEHYENVTMYVNFAKEAEAAGDKKVAQMFRQIAVDEGTHYAAYKAALAKLPRR